MISMFRGRTDWVFALSALWGRILLPLGFLCLTCRDALNPSHCMLVRMGTARLPCVTKTPRDSGHSLASLSTAVRLHMGIVSSLPAQQITSVHPPLRLSPMHARLGGDAHLPFLAYLLCSAGMSTAYGLSASFSGHTWPGTRIMLGSSALSSRWTVVF